MKRNLASFAVGLIFALGLGIVGMTQTSRVVGFLDIFGSWDPTLLFVMAAALAVHMPLYRIIRKRKHPLLESKWYVPAPGEIDLKLLLGAAIFGVGWGLAGYCPGPALVSLASFSPNPVIFVGAMALAMALYPKDAK